MIPENTQSPTAKPKLPAAKTAAPAEAESSSDWLAEINLAKKREENWRKKGRKVLERYRDERPTDGFSPGRGEHRTNILWANTEVLMSHLCGDLGQPDVRRMFPSKTKRGRVARVAADLLEKTLTADDHGYDVTHEFEGSIQDMLLPGRGQVWLELEVEDGASAPEVSAAESDDDSEAEEQVNVQRATPDITWVQANIVHVPWEFFLFGQSKRWQEVPWVGRLHLFSRQDLRDSFPTHADKIKLDYEIDGAEKQQTNSKSDMFRRAGVWEIWCKESRERLYVAENYSQILKKDKDPYNLKGFFPCPRPIYAVSTTGSTEPIPEFTLYQDQANELDRITQRTNRLTEALKYCGIYGGSGDEVLPDIAHLEDGEFIPFKNFSALANSGGLAGVFLTRDLAPIATTLEALDMRRERVVQAIYELTGIADIIRGSSDPGETLGAQKLKAQFGSSRSGRRQTIVQRFVRDAYRLKAELIAEHYPRSQLVEMTGIMLPTLEEQAKAKAVMGQIQQAMQAQQAQQAQAQPQGAPGQPQAPAPQQQAMPPIDPDMMQELNEAVNAVAWDDVAQILRTDARRCFNVDIETDDTAFVDEADAQQSATAFMQAMLSVLTETVPAVQASPALMPLVKELLLFTARTFKPGSSFEDVLNETMDNVASQPPQPQADPAKDAQAQIIQLQAQTAQVKLETEKQEGALKIQLQQALLQLKQLEVELKKQGMQVDLAGKQQKTQLDMADRAHKADVTMSQRAQDAKVAEIEAATEHASRIHAHHMDAAGRELDHTTKLAAAEHAHQTAVHASHFQANQEAIAAADQHQRRMQDAEFQAQQQAQRAQQQQHEGKHEIP